MSLCLAAIGAVVAVIAADSFTLTWTHSVEKSEWRESWRIEAGRLVLDQAEIAGSGAGMEPPADARLEGGRWHYRPVPVLAVPALTLAASAAGGDYRLCWADACAALGALLPAGLPGPVTVQVCDG
jgi:hypothetical protein